MKKLILFTLFCGLASSLLLHSQAVKVTSAKEVQVGKGDPTVPLSRFSEGVHTLTFGDGRRGNTTFYAVPPRSN